MFVGFSYCCSLSWTLFNKSWLSPSVTRLARRPLWLSDLVTTSIYLNCFFNLSQLQDWMYTATSDIWNTFKVFFDLYNRLSGLIILSTHLALIQVFLWIAQLTIGTQSSFRFKRQIAKWALHEKRSQLHVFANYDETATRASYCHCKVVFNIRLIVITLAESTALSISTAIKFMPRLRPYLKWKTSAISHCQIE